MTETRQKPGKLQEQINFYLTIVVLLLLVLMPPIGCSLIYLSRVPDVTWNRDDGITYDRIFMHRERRPVGIGYQRQRITTTYSPTEACAETRLRFLLWGNSSEASPVNYSQRIILSDGNWQLTGQPCN